MHRTLALMTLAACGSHADPPPPPVVAPVARPDAMPADAAPEPAPVVRTSANDDLPHRTAQLAPQLAPAITCVPGFHLLDEDPDPTSLALDTWDGHLVACAQVLTRRGGSVFLDPVSYACWNVDPATGALTRRADLARAYFRCQDGRCAAGADPSVIGYDGTEVLAFDDEHHQLSITTRAGAAVRTFPSPDALAGLAITRGTLTYAGHTIFAVTDKGVLVLDDHGKRVALVPGRDVHVLDAGHVLVTNPTDPASTIVDLATHETRPAQVAFPAAGEAVMFGGALYTITDLHLLILDAKTFAMRSSRELAVCPAR